MTRHFVRFTSSGALGLWCVLWNLLAWASPVLAGAEPSFQVQLVWGTNGEKPADKSLKEIDSKLQERLKGVFKWTNYYEVGRKPLIITTKDAPTKLKLSDKCEIQVQDAGPSRIEIRLFGEGKLVVKKVQNVVPGEVIVLAGDGKDDTAWFVVLTPGK